MKIKLLFIITFFSQIIQSQTFNGASSFGSATVDNSQAIFTDSAKNIFVCGLFSSTLTFGSTTISSSGGNADGYLAKYNASGVPQWIKKFGSNNDEVVRNVTTDSNGNIFLTGYFQGVNFDANPSSSAVYTLAQPAMILSRDCFIIKLDSNGDFIWAKQISNLSGGALNEDSYDVKVDTNNNIYIAGRFNEADFDTSSGTNIITSYGPNYATDGFILKLDQDGNSIWIKKFGGDTADIISALKIDSSNNIYATGVFTGTADFDPSANTATATSTGNNDVFMVKLNSNGDYVFHKTFGGSQADYPNSINFDTTGNIYISGYYNGTADLNPSATVTNVTSNGGTDNFILKLDSSGNYVSHYASGSANGDQIYGTEISSTNRIIVSGTYGQAFDIDTSAATVNTSFVGGTADIFILELDTDLNYISHYQFGSSGTETLPWCSSNGNEIIVVGSYQNSIDLDPSSGTFSSTASGNYDVFLSRFMTSQLTINENNVLKTEFYPNPFSNIISIKNNSYTNYSVFSLTGIKICSGAILNDEINLSSLNQGMYLIEFINEEETIVKKIIKQ